MPVQNETLYNVKRLNLVFAVSSVAFLVITAWMMIEDHNATWKYHQADFQRTFRTNPFAAEGQFAGTRQADQQR